MIESILFGNMLMPEQNLRLLIAFLGLAATTYYDLFNNKNIPEKILFAFLGISILFNFIFFDQTLFIFSLVLAVIVGILGYLLHRAGQIGSADIFVICSLIFLVPIHPTYSNLIFNFPFIFSLIVFSGVLFALYILIYYSYKIMKSKKAKPNYFSFLIFLPYLFFVYAFLSFPIFSVAYFSIVSIIIFSTVFFLAYKEDINKMLAKKIPIKKAEEDDVLAIEYMDKKIMEKYKPEKVLSAKEIQRLKKLKIKELWVYTELPPFLPFLFAGFILSVFFANILIS
ncbi:MAG: hypothetical protein WC501_04515 [Candidatus Micrarchaeia archaeon]